MMALEIAMDEMAERLGLDPIEFRSRQDTQVDPEHRTAVFAAQLTSACGSGPNVSVGTHAIRSRARSATAVGWSASAWLRRSATTW